MIQDDLLTELNKLVERLKKDRDVKRVLLFGSLAQGNIRVDSDIDLIIVKDTEKKFLDRLDEFYENASVPMDILVYTPREFEAMKLRPFVKRAIAEGVILYEA